MDFVHHAWIDTDNDGYCETSLTDLNADGRADIQMIDFNHDGSADTLLGDTDADGVADIQVTAAPVTTAPVTPTVSVADPAPFPEPAGAGPFPVDAAAPPVPGMSSSTAMLLDSINAGMADAGTIYQAAMEPGTVSAADEAAAMERIDNASRMAGALEGHIAAQEIANDVHADEINRSAADAAREYANDTWIDAERARNAADWAVWESERAR